MNIYERLPKAELHLHLRGAMPVTVFCDLLNKYSADEVLRDIPAERRERFLQNENITALISNADYSEDAVKKLFDYTDFGHFLWVWSFTGLFFRQIEDFRAMVSEVIDSLIAQNIVYAEITVATIEYIRHGVPIEDIFDCLDDASDNAEIHVNWIIDLVRNSDITAMINVLDGVIEYQSDNTVGITIGGDEAGFPPAQFKAVYEKAKSAGFKLSAHAGEGAGPQSVWDAIIELNVDRIGHGVRSIEDPELVAYLAEKQIPLEVCPGSNICTGIYPSLAEHPIKALFDAGVPITINTDDPTFFGNNLADEYNSLLDIGFTEDNVLRIIENGFRYSFASDIEKKKYLDKLETAYTQYK